MVKLIIFCSKVTIAVVTALLLTSCKYDINLGNGIEGNGNVKTETRDITEKFTKISSNRGIEVIVDQDATTEIQVEADENLLQHITTKVENGTLVISSDENIDSAEKLIVHVKTPTINGLEATSGSTISTKKTITGNAIQIKSSSGSEINAIVEYDKVATESTSGSNIEVSGKALNLNTSTSSGSTTDAGDLIANDVVAESSSGSSTEVHAAVVLSAHASSGSSIEYNGSPKEVRKEENSGGSVSKK
jgi:Putative auto-transporter adhesin, head GIN domain